MSGPQPREIQRTVSAEGTTKQGPARVHLVIGPVGAGKSTFAIQLARERAGVHLSLDAWMVQLFSPDRPATGVVDWYVARAARCVEQIWTVATSIIDVERDVVLEIGLLSPQERARFYRKVDSAGVPMIMYVLDAAREVRRARVLQRNRDRGATFSMLVPPEIFELASDLWQPPDAAECDGRDVRFLRTDS